MAEVRVELHIDNDIVCVPVRLLVCQSCGERYYDRRTLRYLEEIEDKLRKDKGALAEVGRVFVYR